MDVVEFQVTDVDGVEIVSIVDKPAIEEGYLFFSDQRNIGFAVDNERRIISGPVMIPDKLIFRKRDDGSEFQGFFTKETIEKIVLKFMESGKGQQANIMHTSTLAKDTFIFESWIKDSTRGVPAMKGFDDLSDGTWFISMKVNCNESWAKIKSGEFAGFSVEGLFTLEDKPKNEKQMAAELLAFVNNLSL